MSSSGLSSTFFSAASFSAICWIEPVDVFLRRAGGKDRRELLSATARPDGRCRPRPPAASSRSAFCQRPTSSAMNSRSSLRPQVRLELAEALEHQFAHRLVQPHRGVHRRRIEQARGARPPPAIGSIRSALLQGRQHHGRLLLGVLVVELPFGPVLLGPQRDDALDHVQRRGVGRRVGPARLADDQLHLGKPPQQGVAGLEVVGRLGHRRPRHRHRHVENAPFVQRRHVVHADLGEVVGRQGQGRQRDERQDLPLRARGEDDGDRHRDRRPRRGNTSAKGWARWR